uniref:Ig-like domain-containing protein n=1 Tax=Monodelphis domestica TaxID=13616 RepID=F6RSL4_MONDO
MLLWLLLPLLWEGSLSQVLQVPSSVTVQEGLCAQVLCTFYPRYSIDKSYPAYGSWFREWTNTDYGKPVATNARGRQVERGAQGRFRLLGDPQRKNCSLSISDARTTDSGRYFFRFEQGEEKYNIYHSLLSVSVTGLSQKPDISVPEVLEAGTPVTLNCTFPSACWDDSTYRFSWSGAALPSPHNGSGPSPSSEVSFTPGLQHHGTPVTCQVTLPGGYLTAQRTIFLNVSYAAQNMTISLSQGNRTTGRIGSSPVVVQEGESLHLLCAANSRPPATLSWMLGNQTLVSSQPSDDAVLSLKLPQLRPADGGKYTCLAQHPLGSKNVSLIISVQCEWEWENQQGIHTSVFQLVTGERPGGRQWEQMAPCAHPHAHSKLTFVQIGPL